MRRRSFVPGVLVLSLAACGPSMSGDDGGDDDVGAIDARVFYDSRPPSEFVDAAPQEQCDKMDIVFIIDNSGSMAEEQTNLANNFPGFVQVLDNYTTSTGAPLDYRIAVTTTGRDVTSTISIPGFPPISMTEQGENGEFQMGSGCGMTKRWLEKMDPNVASTFSCVAQVGTGGPSFEMPLLMTDWSLTDRMAAGQTNVGFLREDALLGVIMITDENDCSRTDDNFTVSGTGGDVCDPSDPNLVPVGEFLTTLDMVKGDRGRWAAAVIAGDMDCTSDFGDALEATRLKDFVQMAGPSNAVFSSICAGDLTAALQDALATFDAACQAFPPIGKPSPR